MRNVVDDELDAAYRQMASEEFREAEALEWVDGTAEDFSEETR